MNEELMDRELNALFYKALRVLGHLRDPPEEETEGKPKFQVYGERQFKGVLTEFLDYCGKNYPDAREFLVTREIKL